MATYRRMFIVAVVPAVVLVTVAGIAVSPSSWAVFLIVGALLGLAVFGCAVFFVRLSWRDKT